MKLGVIGVRLFNKEDKESWSIFPGLRRRLISYVNCQVRNHPICELMSAAMNIVVEWCHNAMAMDCR